MIPKRKLMIFIDWFVPAYKAGGPISSIRNLAEALSGSFDIYIVTGDTDLGDVSPLLDITTNKWIKFNDYKVIYLPSTNQTSAKYSELLNEIKPEVVHLNSLFSKNFTLTPLTVLRKHPEIKTIVSPRGMFGPESLKIKPLKKKLFFIYANLNNLFKNVTWHATSEIEKREIEQKIKKINFIKIAPNFSYLPKIKLQEKDKSIGELRLINVGRISPIKNIHFLLKALNEITSNVSLTIVGPVEDENYYEQCKDLASQLPKNCSAQFITGVNHNEIGKLYLSHDVFISPTLNENFGHSIVEAMGFGCPVIISDKTPWKSLNKENVGFDLPLNLNSFSEAIEFFAKQSSDEFHPFCLNARNKAESIHSSNGIFEQYKDLYQ